MPITVGILSRRSRTDPDRLFGRPTDFFSECSIEAERMGIRVVVFEAEDLDPAGASIQAASYTGGGWIEREAVPFPDVIYDRAPVFDDVYTPIADLARQHLIDSAVPFVNPLALLRFTADKFASYEQLVRYGMRLPETSVLAHESLTEYADRFGHVFLKPVRGSNGDGIIEIRRWARTRFLMRHGTAHKTIYGTKHLVSAVDSVLGNSVFQDGVYLVQQGVSSEHSGNTAFPRFDLRVIMQKNEQHIWGLTGIAARVCQSDVPTANLSTGAWAEVAEHVLDERYGPAIRDATLDAIFAMCLAICHRLDEALCRFGELGVDIVTDADGRPWILEINAKPGRSVFRRIARFTENEEDRRRFAQIRQRSVALPFRYARSIIQPPVPATA